MNPIKKHPLAKKPKQSNWAKYPKQNNPQYNQAEWKKNRRLALERDGCCVQCGSTENLTVDHIRRLSQGGTHDLANLRTLCKRCHDKRSGTDGARERNKKYGPPRWIRPWIDENRDDGDE